MNKTIKLLDYKGSERKFAYQRLKIERELEKGNNNG